MAKTKKYKYDSERELRTRNVPRTLKDTITLDRQQKGISESALVKGILTEHYQRNPLILIPHFLED